MEGRGILFWSPPPFPSCDLIAISLFSPLLSSTATSFFSPEAKGEGGGGSSRPLGERQTDDGPFLCVSWSLRPSLKRREEVEVYTLLYLQRPRRTFWMKRPLEGRTDGRRKGGIICCPPPLRLHILSLPRRSSSSSLRLDPSFFFLRSLVGRWGSGRQVEQEGCRGL